MFTIYMIIYFQYNSNDSILVVKVINTLLETATWSWVPWPFNNLRVKSFSCDGVGTQSGVGMSLEYGGIRQSYVIRASRCTEKD